MNKFNLKTTIIFMLVMAVSFSSCQAIADIFKAGVWVGVIVVVVIIALIFWLISEQEKNNVEISFLLNIRLTYSSHTEESILNSSIEVSFNSVNISVVC